MIDKVEMGGVFCAPVPDFGVFISSSDAKSPMLTEAYLALCELETLNVPSRPTPKSTFGFRRNASSDLRDVGLLQSMWIVLCHSNLYFCVLPLWLCLEVHYANECGDKKCLCLYFILF